LEKAQFKREMRDLGWRFGAAAAQAMAPPAPGFRALSVDRFLRRSV